MPQQRRASVVFVRVTLGLDALGGVLGDLCLRLPSLAATRLSLVNGRFEIFVLPGAFLPTSGVR